MSEPTNNASSNAVSKVHDEEDAKMSQEKRAEFNEKYSSRVEEKLKEKKGSREITVGEELDIIEGLQNEMVRPLSHESFSDINTHGAAERLFTSQGVQSLFGITDTIDDGAVSGEGPTREQSKRDFSTYEGSANNEAGSDTKDGSETAPSDFSASRSTGHNSVRDPKRRKGES